METGVTGVEMGQKGRRSLEANRNLDLLEAEAMARYPEHLCEVPYEKLKKKT
jgi:hypothetical protein